MRPIRLILPLLLLAASHASPFVVQTNRMSTGQIVQLHWPERAARSGIPFGIDSRGSRSIADRVGTYNAIRAGFKAWEAQTTTFLRFSDQGLLDSPVISSRDRLNFITFDETGALIGAPPDAGIIAITRINSDERTGEIFDTDLVFNGRDFRFGIGDPTTIRPPIVDLQATATHEIGHILGLDHTGLSGASLRRPVMNPYDNGDATGGARILKPDDVAGVGYLYPSEAFSGTGRISGTVRKPDGTDAFGVQVVAYNESGNFVVSGLSGYSTGRGGSGEYALIGLEPGRYAVGIEPLNGQVTYSNFGGIFHQPFDTDFQPKYYDNAFDRPQAQVFRALAGQEISGIHFSTGLFPFGFPSIQNLILPANTPDTQGPYTVQISVTDDRGVSKVVLYYRVGGGSEVPVAMRPVPSQPAAYAAEIPGQARGSAIDYHIEATDTDGNVSRYPIGDVPSLRLKVLSLTGKPLAYVSLRRSNAVSVLDTGSDPAPTEVARIPVGEDPIGLCITPDEKIVCVSSRVKGTVTLIETASNRILATVAVGREPVDLVASADGRFLYVSNTTDNDISVIDLGSRKQMARLPVRAQLTGPSPPGPYGIAVSPDGKRLCATVMNDNVVVVLEASGGAELARIPVVAQPRSLAYSPDGKTLYVTGLADGAGVSVVDAATNQVTARIPVAATAKSFDIAISRDGRTAYVTDYTNSVIVIDTEARAVRQVIPIPGQNTRGIATSLDGATVYISNQDTDELVVIDAATGRILRSVPVAQGPRDIAFRNRPVVPDSDPGSAIAADFDGSGAVDFADFFMFAAAFGTVRNQPGYETRFDLNGDGGADFGDFFLFADQFGRRTR